MTASEIRIDENFPPRTALAVVYSSFVLAGVVTIILGPLLPILIARWSLSDQGAGLFFTLQFSGNLLGILSIGMLIARLGYGSTIGMGFALVAAGIGGLNFDSHLLGLLAVAMFGYGLGLILTATNLWVAAAAGTRRAAALTISNLAWGIGAVSCPLLILLAQRTQRLGLLLFGIAGLSFLFALALMSIQLEPPSASAGAGATPAVQAGPRSGLKAGLVLGAFFFLYCGTESAIGGWIAAYAKRLGSTGGNTWELAPMFFWAGLLTGRALGPLVLRSLTEKVVLVAGLALAAASNGALLWWADPRATAICLAGIGLGFACVFPLLVAALVGYFGQRATRIGSVVFALASVGGATIPWLVGFTSTHAGGLRVGLSVPLIGCVAMLGLLWHLPKQQLN